MILTELFHVEKPLIACIHLMPLPGSPRYSGSMRDVYDTALSEIELFKRYPIDGLIIENFRDKPFYPNKVPAETISAMAALTREAVKAFSGPVGVNVLRNDAQAAVAIATAAEADFIRVNIHMSAVVSEQGIIQGASHETMRLRAALRSSVLIFADVGVKHAAPFGGKRLEVETKNLTERGLADAIIVSGELTGSETKPEDIDIVRQNTDLPIIVGSGATPENLHKVYSKVDALIVGSYFKKDGKGDNLVEEERVRAFTGSMSALKGGR